MHMVWSRTTGFFVRRSEDGGGSSSSAPVSCSRERLLVGCVKFCSVNVQDGFIHARARQTAAVDCGCMGYWLLQIPFGHTLLGGSIVQGNNKKVDGLSDIRSV